MGVEFFSFLGLSSLDEGVPELAGDGVAAWFSSPSYMDQPGPGVGYIFPSGSEIIIWDFYIF